MALTSNGNVLVRLEAPYIDQFSIVLSQSGGAILPGYTLESLIPTAPTATFGLNFGGRWMLARPATTPTKTSPWDQAHAAAASINYAHYVEPDILHEMPAAASGQDMDPAWPPKTPASPGWHLDADFTGFGKVRDVSTGKGIRIAHLDTGYTPGHVSTPKNLLSELSFDFVDDKPGAIDPLNSGGLNNPGHGTATLALLAAGHLNLTYKGQKFEDVFGGAPDAAVMPVRISESVIHIYTSTMAKGLQWALKPKGEIANRCDVVTISHGGLPTPAWADAVNDLYNNGVVVVAASGDSIFLVLADIATRFTVYPSAFNRVVTAVGVTYEKGPYKTTAPGEMQGCWGPDDVMDKAVAGYTPNVAWMDATKLPDGFRMHGAGTSSSTPQVAAACALWLSTVKSRLQKQWPNEPWRVVEACRLALFDAADPSENQKPALGWGPIRAVEMLSSAVTEKAIARAASAQQEPIDQVSFALWRLLFGFGPPGSAEDRMYETEVAQTVLQSTNMTLRAIARQASDGNVSSADAQTARSLLLQEGVSAALAKTLAAAPALIAAGARN